MSFCVILSETNPLFHKQDVSFEDLLSHRSVTHHLPLNCINSLSITANKLKNQGYCIEPTLETDSLMVAMQAVKRGMSFFAPRSIGELFLNVISTKPHFYPVKLIPMPKEVAEQDEHGGNRPLQICWHERSNNDLAHRWLRERIIYFMRESPWMQLPE